MTFRTERSRIQRPSRCSWPTATTRVSPELLKAMPLMMPAWRGRRIQSRPHRRSPCRIQWKSVRSEGYYESVHRTSTVARSRPRSLCNAAMRQCAGGMKGARGFVSSARACGARRCTAARTGREQIGIRQCGHRRNPVLAASRLRCVPCHGQRALLCHAPQRDQAVLGAGHKVFLVDEAHTIDGCAMAGKQQLRFLCDLPQAHGPIVRAACDGPLARQGINARHNILVAKADPGARQERAQVWHHVYVHAARTGFPHRPSGRH